MIETVGALVGLIGGTIGAIAGIYTLLEKLWLNKPKLGYEVLRHGITNFYRDETGKEGYSEMEILISLCNIGGGVLGIGKVLVKSKDEKKYPIAIIASKYESGRKGGEIRSFTLSKNECRELVLWEQIGFLCKEEKKLDAEIHVHDSEFKIMKKIPVELYVGAMPMPMRTTE